MQYSKEIFEQFDKIYITGFVLRELERNKHSINEEKKYLSRRACRDIEENSKTGKVIFYVSENKYNLPDDFDKDSIDNRIISNIKELYDRDNEIIALSNDILFNFTCECIGMPCEKFNSDELKEIYNGIREISLSLPEYNQWFNEIDKNPLNLSLNEYLIINNTTKNEQYLYTWNGFYFDEVKVKPITNKYLNHKDAVVPLDIYQKAFIHMLQNDNINVMITDSCYGAGKSYIMLHWALQQLDSGNKYNKMYFVKSDSVPKIENHFLRFQEV